MARDPPPIADDIVPRLRLWVHSRRPLAAGPPSADLRNPSTAGCSMRCWTASWRIRVCRPCPTTSGPRTRVRSRPDRASGIRHASGEMSRTNSSISCASPAGIWPATSGRGIGHLFMDWRHAMPYESRQGHLRTLVNICVWQSFPGMALLHHSMRAVFVTGTQGAHQNNISWAQFGVTAAMSGPRQRQRFAAPPMKAAWRSFTPRQNRRSDCHILLYSTPAATSCWTLPGQRHRADCRGGPGVCLRLELDPCMWMCHTRWRGYRRLRLACLTGQRFDELAQRRKRPLLKQG